jgi:carboxyl-terminal processing protease
MRAAVVLALAALLVVAPLARAQDADDRALVREAYDFVRQYALRPPEASTMLARMLAAVQPHAGAGDGPPPLGGDPQADLEAVAAYAAAVARARPERAEIVLAAVLRALLQDLDDPLAAVFPPAQFARYMEDLRGEHGGIGAQVDLVGGRIVVSDVTAGGPAARAGIAAGDALLDVNGRPTADRTPDTVLDFLHGRPGTTVAITVQRGSRAPQRHILTREVVRENPTRSTLLEPRIGYLRLLEFIEGSGQDVGRALAGLRPRGAAALILDLRQNTGGLVEEAVAVASFFLGEGVVAMEENREGMVPLPVRPAARFVGPVVVLVDFFTASAGEIVAGALQDAGAVLVGTKTFGKATVQSVSIPPLPGGWGLRVTTARYYTRRGRLIEGTGLQPTVAVPMPIAFIQSSQDVQLQEALGRLRAQLGARSGRP